MPNNVGCPVADLILPKRNHDVSQLALPGACFLKCAWDLHDSCWLWFWLVFPQGHPKASPPISSTPKLSLLAGPETSGIAVLPLLLVLVEALDRHANCKASSGRRRQAEENIAFRVGRTCGFSLQQNWQRGVTAHNCLSQRSATCCHPCSRQPVKGGHFPSCLSHKINCGQAKGDQWDCTTPT